MVRLGIIFGLSMLLSGTEVGVAFSGVPSSARVGGGLRLGGRQKKSESLDYDPYGGFLDVDTTMKGSVATVLEEEWSLDETDKAPTKKSKLNKEPLQWAHWDPFMEQEFGNMDRELGHDEQWMYEIRDAVELNRGIAIWSKRSDKEISAEKNRVRREKGVHVPAQFDAIITRVFLEKTATMREIRAENELSAIEFRKFMLETAKKLKTKPLPRVKRAVADKWLGSHPRISLRARGVYGQSPEVIMDELRSPLADVQFELKRTDGSSSSSPSAVSIPASVARGSMGQSRGGKQNKVATLSMTNWDRALEDLPDSMTATCVSTNSAASSESLGFDIDGEDIFVATEDDYYVVM